MPATQKEPRLRVDAPRIVERAARRVAVVRTTGAPAEAARRAIPALYRAVYGLKMARKHAGADFTVGALRARWPYADAAPPEQWVGEWALTVPEDVPQLPGTELETWQYGLTAEILHVGPFSTEGETLAKLHAFLGEHGYEVAGPHEEEYLTRPDARVQRTVIRYPVRRRLAS